MKLGLKENIGQFLLLILVNAFVGGMVGLERSILPQIAEAEFHIAASTAVLSFIVVFGLVKALTNYFTGALANRLGRKNLLVIGWLFALPVPWILMQANDWNWIVAANVLLGINQGLAWSSTVVMKIDLVGEKNRGLAMGLNEFAGYLSVAIVAFLTGWIASEFGLRPYPFYLGIGLSLGRIAGFLDLGARYTGTCGDGNRFEWHSPIEACFLGYPRPRPQFEFGDASGLGQQPQRRHGLGIVSDSAGQQALPTR